MRHRPDVEQVMRDTAALMLGELRRADVHAPVELHRVRIDDLGESACGGKSTRNRDRQVRLASGSRPDDRDDALAQAVRRRRRLGSWNRLGLRHAHHASRPMIAKPSGMRDHPEGMAANAAVEPPPARLTSNGTVKSVTFDAPSGFPASVAAVVAVNAVAL